MMYQEPTHEGLYINICKIYKDIYTHIYKDTYTSTYTKLHVYNCIRTYTWVPTHKYMHTLIPWHMGWRTLLWIGTNYAHAYRQALIWISVYGDYPNGHVRTHNDSVHMHPWRESLCVCMHVCIYVCVYIYIYTYVYMCVCVRRCIAYMVDIQKIIMYDYFHATPRNLKNTCVSLHLDLRTCTYIYSHLDLQTSKTREADIF